MAETLRFPLFSSCYNARRCVESRTQSQSFRALYWRSNSENRAVAGARSEIRFFAKSTQSRNFVPVKKRECAENHIFDVIWELLKRRFGRFRVSGSDLPRKPRWGCGSGQEQKSAFSKRKLFNRKPENHPSVEQVLAATKSDATLVNVSKTLCFQPFLSSRSKGKFCANQDDVQNAPVPVLKLDNFPVPLEARI